MERESDDKEGRARTGQPSPDGNRCGGQKRRGRGQVSDHRHAPRSTAGKSRRARPPSTGAWFEFQGLAPAEDNYDCALRASVKPTRKSKVERDFGDMWPPWA